MDRRGFLLGGACSLAASPLITPVALAAAPWDRRLVVIILRGAMDGLDALRPLGDPDFAALRRDMAPDALGLDGYWALHPSFAPLEPLWQAGEFGAVHAVSTPYRDKRSHFDGQDILEAGLPDLTRGGLRDGWLNRVLQLQTGLEAEIAFAVGREDLLVLSGDAPISRWSPEAKLRLSPQARLLLDRVYHDDPLFQQTSFEAMQIVESLAEAEAMAEQTEEMMGADPMMAQARGRGEHRQLAEFAATRLRGDTRIASFSLGGWDTHVRQQNTFARAADDLADTILTLRAGLGEVWAQTAVVCVTEFGRTAAQNGNLGTDHGTGGAMLFFGGALRGGRVVADWPGLAEADLYDRRDLMPTRDVRAHLAWIIAGITGLPRAGLERAVFPGLQMGEDPGLLA
ncbi:MAG: hypothetical protein HLUCCA08_15560 [Rhodobacteraceae bacterium HLUCCA08]|nr:MAG: hypothetical protein HLUCCA08_15560 [Rhodobacteraceae bacterium HLUCCA08]